MKTQGEAAALQLLQKMADQSAATAEQCLSRRKYEDVLRSLLFPEIVQRHSEIPSAHQNTFGWALNDESTNLSRWLREGEGTYWIQGKAGSGKSTLMKYLEQESKTKDELRTWASGRPLVLASHYFWAVGTDIQRSLKGLLQTLLFRVFVQDPDIIPEICRTRIQPGSYDHVRPWTLEELQHCFESLSTLDLPSRICFLIDGLDEFQGNREELVRIVKTTALSKGIKLCVSSRPWQRFEKAFGHTNQWQLAVHTHTRTDIYLYAQSKLNANERCKQLRQSSPHEVDALADGVAKASDGVFLWVYLVVRQLLEGLEEYNEDIPTLMKRLKDFPTDLEEYFRRMLMTIDKAYHYESSVIFSMLISAHGPISTGLTMAWREFVGALSREFSEQDFEFAFRNGLLSDLRKLWNSDVVKHSGLNYPKSPTEGQRESLYNCTAREKRRVSSTCKDLVHVSEEEPVPPSTIPGHHIGLLHRSVSDFLLLESTRKTIEDRLEPQESILSVGLRGQAQAYLFLLRLMSKQTAGACRLVSKGMFIRVIHFVKELHVISPLESQLILFLLWSLVLNNQENLLFVPKMSLFDANCHREDDWSESISRGSGDLRDLRESPLARNLQLIVQATMAVYSFHGTAPHDQHRTLYNYGREIQSLYLSLVCPQCWKEFSQDASLHKHWTVARALILIYLSRFKAALPHADLEHLSNYDIEASTDRSLYAILPKSADLDLFENLVVALEPDGKDFERRLQNLWTCFLEAACFLSEILEAVPPGTWSFPRNLRQVVETLVRHGAARFLLFSESSSTGDHLQHLKLYWKRLNGNPVSHEASDVLMRVDTLEILRRLMEMTAVGEDGTVAFPLQKTFDLDSGNVVSGNATRPSIFYHLSKWLR